MNRQEATRLNQQEATLQSLGFTAAEARSLRRISNTLRRWYERECNGEIERNEETGHVHGYNPNAHYLDPHDPRAYYSVADRERGAERRLAAIIAARNERARNELQACPNCQQWQYPPTLDCFNECVKRGLVPSRDLTSYLQTDPRGASLYILRPGDVPAGADPSSYYSRGICVY